MQRPDSPCVGYCSTALGDDVCRGCNRTFDEVTRWVTMTESEKQAVWDRLFSEHSEGETYEQP